MVSGHREGEGTLKMASRFGDLGKKEACVCWLLTEAEGARGRPAGRGREIEHSTPDEKIEQERQCRQLTAGEKSLSEQAHGGRGLEKTHGGHSAPEVGSD